MYMIVRDVFGALYDCCRILIYTNTSDSCFAMVLLFTEDENIDLFTLVCCSGLLVLFMAVKYSDFIAGKFYMGNCFFSATKSERLQMCKLT